MCEVEKDKLVTISASFSIYFSLLPNLQNSGVPIFLRIKIFFNIKNLQISSNSSFSINLKYILFKILLMQ